MFAVSGAMDSELMAVQGFFVQIYGVLGMIGFSQLHTSLFCAAEFAVLFGFVVRRVF